MKKLSMIVIGAGGRGRGYAGFAAEHRDMYDVVGIAEPIAIRRKYIQDKLPDIDMFVCDDWREILDRPRFADIAVIATMDRDHMGPALKAIELGYDILLEKPIAPTPEECKLLCEAAEAKGTRILICHVLRYTPFFKALKKFIDSGKLGRVLSIIHTEGVGNVHYSHSFIRGNWGNSDKSTVMLLQKSCHDMDILQWLIGAECRSVQSFGSLTHFTHENRPEGAPDYCLDGCPHADTCHYYVGKVYLNEERNPHKWMRRAVGDNPRPTTEEVVESLRRGPYGRCVYACDNNVVDHQVVNLEFDNEVNVAFTMSAFNEGGRVIRIMGTEGELEAAMGKEFAHYYSFAEAKGEDISLIAAAGDESIAGGHGGGDAGIMTDLYWYIAEGKVTDSICDIRTAYKNHLIAFAGEESRVTGKVINMKDFEAKI